MIQPNCRIQFTADDIDFITRVLGTKMEVSGCLVMLPTDPDTRDLILDDEALFHALLEETVACGSQTTSISTSWSATSCAGRESTIALWRIT